MSGNDDLSQALKEAYAHATEAIIFNTLEFRHDDLPSAYGGALRIVHEYENLTATLEDDAPLNPGEEVTFLAYAFDVDLPPIDEGGKSEMIISIGNVHPLTDAFDAVAASDSILEMTYRPYLSTDLTKPAMSPLITLEIPEVTISLQRIRLKARFRSFQNMKFPSLSYTPDAFPTL